MQNGFVKLQHHWFAQKKKKKCLDVLHTFYTLKAGVNLFIPTYNVKVQTFINTKIYVRKALSDLQK